MLQGVLNKEVLLDIELINIPRKSNKCPCQDFDVAKKNFSKETLKDMKVHMMMKKLNGFVILGPFPYNSC